MNKFASTGLLALALGVIAMPVVHAQSTQPVVKPISIKIGAYLPTDGSARSAAGSTLLAIGADYAFQKSAADSPVEPLVYADYTGGSKNGGHLDLFGIGVGLRAYPDRTNDESVIPFYGVGIGLDALDAHGSGSSSKTNIQVGGKVEVGVEMNTGPFAEAEYQYVPQKADGIRADGFNVMVGDRF